MLEDGSVIQNLNISDVKITGTAIGYAGILAGRTQGIVTIDNVSVTNSSINLTPGAWAVEGDTYIGGIVGYADDNSTLAVNSCAVDSLTNLAGSSGENYSGAIYVGAYIGGAGESDSVTLGQDGAANTNGTTYPEIGWQPEQEKDPAVETE